MLYSWDVTQTKEFKNSVINSFLGVSKRQEIWTKGLLLRDEEGVEGINQRTDRTHSKKNFVEKSGTKLTCTRIR